MITKSIERAQKKVEENNFGIRKRLIEYDDVMNAQRDVIYKRRKNALFGDRLSIDITNSMYDISDSIVTEFHEAKDFDNFNIELIRLFSIESPVTEAEFMSMKADDLTLKVYSAAEKHYREKNNRVAKQVFPVVKQVYENQAQQFENIVTPFTDGIRTIQVVANLKKCYDTNGRDMVLAFEKIVSLAMIDDSWKEHLRELDDLKQAVQNAALEQKDPLLIYKLESFNLFKEMALKTGKETVSFLVKGALPSDDPNQQMQQARFQQAPQQQKKEQLTESRSEDTPQEKPKPKIQPVRVEKTVGRNDPCPCGSGKKYKACHGQ
jgi:preprotein translocase subunit SecA